MFSMKGMISFSELIIPVIAISSVNSSLAMPSKHFLRWGWTQSGSLVCDRICSSSSLDKKKNLEIDRRCDKAFVDGLRKPRHDYYIKSYSPMTSVNHLGK